MAKLTPTQKAANKAAHAVRDRAYRARRDSYHQARESAEAALDKTDYATARDDATNAFNLAIDVRNNALDAIDQQIRELQKKRADVEESHKGTINALRARRDAAWDAYRVARNATIEAVEREFSDVSSLWSVCGWTIPAEIQAEMDAAAAAAIAAHNSTADQRPLPT